MPCAADRPKTDTIIVPADRRVEWCLADLDRTSRSDAIPGNAWTQTAQLKCRSLTSFNPPTTMIKAYARTSALLSLEAGTA